MATGSCLCGDIAWETDVPVSRLTSCHCSMCRKIHGTAFGTYGAVPAVHFRWVSGADHAKVFKSSDTSERAFCPTCGSAVAALMPDGETAFMPVGNLDGDVGERVHAHLFTGSTAPWADVVGGGDRYETCPPEWDFTPIEQPERTPPTAGATGGSCLCGNVRFEFDGTSQRMGYCHCSRCRKSRSAAYATQLFVPASDFSWVSGEDQVTTWKLPDAANYVVTFCTTCSSPVPTILPDDVAMIPAGALDQDPVTRPMAHIYVGSKADWVELDDTLPRFDEMPPL